MRAIFVVLCLPLVATAQERIIAQFSVYHFPDGRRIVIDESDDVPQTQMRFSYQQCPQPQMSYGMYSQPAPMYQRPIYYSPAPRYYQPAPRYQQYAVPQACPPQFGFSAGVCIGPNCPPQGYYR